jgi:cystathionine beta-lyase/cystathionine gamma-synthase
VCASIPKENFDASNIEHKLVRFYIGLENPQVLIDDIEQAMERI